MKYIKMLGLLAVSAAALLAFAGPASADTLTGPSGEGTPTVHAVSKGHVTLSNPIANISCPSTSEGAVTAHPEGAGPAGRVQGNFSVLTFGHTGNPCTNSWHVTVVTPGTLSVEWIANGEGTVRSTEATVTTTRFGITCNYVTNETDVGTFTDHTKAANGKGELDIKAEINLHTGSSPFCGQVPGKWEGTYESTTTLTLHNT